MMALLVWILAIAAFLSVGAVVVFIMLVIGIRIGDRARDLSDVPRRPLDALTRRMLGIGLCSGCPAGHDYHEEN
jgi:hypothetical protein